MHQNTTIRWLVFILIVWQVTPSWSQVNTEAMRRLDDRMGWMGSAAVDQQFARGNSDYNIYRGTGRIDYRTTRYHLFAISTFKRGTQKQTRFINKGFVHGRVVRRFQSQLSLEVFGQLEYDDFIRLQRRSLIGGGVRCRLWHHPGETGRFAGAGLMHEVEQYTVSSEGTRHVIRSTNYISGQARLNESVSASFVSYFQFDLQHPADYRLLLDGRLTVKLWKRISLIMSLESRYDNEPLAGVKKQDVQLTNGFKLQW